jgi:threonine synthase
MAVSMARTFSATDVCLPSAGNAGAALAAYAATAGIDAHVFLPNDVARLFVMETEAYGAHVETVDGLITEAARVCAAQAKEHGWYECATLRALPGRRQEDDGLRGRGADGLKLPTILYPTGGGTGLGMWKALSEMQAMGFVGTKRPRMYAVRPRAARRSEGLQEGWEDAPFWEKVTTHVYGIACPRFSATS